jgi:hypothetical protein
VAILLVFTNVHVYNVPYNDLSRVRI